MKKLISMLMVLAMALSLVACGAKTDAPAAQAPEAQAPEAVYTPVSDQTFGGAIKYDPTLPVNNGEEITIDYWLWTSDAIWQAVMDAIVNAAPFIPQMDLME